MLSRDSSNVVVVAIPQSYYEIMSQSISNLCVRNQIGHTFIVIEMDRTQGFFCIWYEVYERLDTKQNY